MEDKKELTKDLLTMSFKELVMQTPFDKITIKMITDGAGVIRPTFYKHFQDKYEVIEWILEKEIASKIQVLADHNMEEEIFRLLCSCLEKDREFYKKLYVVEGPNSFEDLLYRYVFNLLLSLLNKYPLRSPDKIAMLSKDALARFYTFGLTDSLKYWITHDTPYSSEQVCEAYNYIIRNSILDVIEFPRTNS